jgi:hypothetical protein
MSSQSTSISYNPLRSVDSATFTGAFLPIGTAIPTTVRIFKIVNNSNVLITISTDGSTAMDVLPANSFSLYDLGTNRGNPSADTALPAGTQFYASGAAGTGLVYVVSMYAKTPSQTIPL